VELDGGYAQAYVAQANAHLGHVSGNSTDLEDMGGAAEHVDLAIGCLRKAHSLRPSDDEITAALNRASKQQAKKDYYKVRRTTTGKQKDYYKRSGGTTSGAGAAATGGALVPGPGGGGCIRERVRE
jgi:hypothetical protein